MTAQRWGLGAALLLMVIGTSPGAESTCHGSVSNGRLENGVQLPQSGANFTAYSRVGVALGRTFVHSRVAEIIVATYTSLEQAAPGTHFVYGETGWSEGGRIRPHRTHRNGLSVDFFVPVVDGEGRSVALPTGVSNKFGYDLEFDTSGKLEDLTIDFEALAEHLYQLDRAAKARGAGIARVIFDPPYLSRLYATRRGAYLKVNLPFMQKPAWVRHDDHYHVDFAVPCKPLR